MDGCYAAVTHSRISKKSDGRCTDIANLNLDGVEFLSLPLLRYYRGEAKPSIRAVLGSKRLVLCIITRITSKPPRLKFDLGWFSCCCEEIIPLMEGFRTPYSTRRNVSAV